MSVHRVGALADGGSGKVARLRNRAFFIDELAFENANLFDLGGFCEHPFNFAPYSIISRPRPPRLGSAGLELVDLSLWLRNHGKQRREGEEIVL
jgi:hypothetical protein